MSILSVLAQLGRLLPLVPKAIDALKARRRPLDAPLGESEAARALRLEEERRAAEAAKATLRAKD